VPCVSSCSSAKASPALFKKKPHHKTHATHLSTAFEAQVPKKSEYSMVKNSYTSGWQGSDEWGGNVAQVEVPGDAMALDGNAETMNLNNVLLSNIRTHRYFKEQLSALTTFEQVVDQVATQSYACARLVA
jgi:hypothetical protein